MLLATHAMGTRFELVLPDEDSPSLRAAGEEALREIDLWHNRLSRFQPDSLVAAINRERSRRLDAETFALIELCEQVRDLSNGAFDIAIGQSMERLGFHPPPRGRGTGSGLDSRSVAQEQSFANTPSPSPRSGRNSRGPGRQPGVDRDDSESPGGAPHSSAHQLPEPSDQLTDSPYTTSSRTHAPLLLDSSTLTIHLDPSASLDLGAVAKGFALDRAAAILRECGITSALLHGGTSSVVAMGAPADDPRGWAIAIRSDGDPLTVRLRDQSLGVSAPRGRTTPTASHILDPRTGAPAMAGVDTAAVIGPVGTAALCDTWSTALVVLGSHPPGLPHELISHIHTRARGWSSRVPCLTELA
jgi:thiamine biosynthesis lipoprotein ApbE